MVLRWMVVQIYIALLTPFTNIYKYYKQTRGFAWTNEKYCF